MAERAVQTVKRLWKKGADKHLSLLDYNSTPMEGFDASPAQLLMGRRLRNGLPTQQVQLRPHTVEANHFTRTFLKQKATQAFHHDKFATKALPTLEPGQEVRVAPLPGNRHWFPAVVSNHHDNPRSYIVDTGRQKYRRNRQHIRQSTKKANDPPRKEILVELDDNPGEDEATATEIPKERDRPNTRSPALDSPADPPRGRAQYTTRSGRIVRPRERLDL